MAAPQPPASNITPNQASHFSGFTRNRPRADSLCGPDGIAEAELLTYVLNSTTPEDLFGRLKAFVDPGSAYSRSELNLVTQALSVIGYLAALKKGVVAVRDDVDRHCLRCHATYLEKDNARDACSITQVLHANDHLNCELAVPMTRNIARRHTTNMVAAQASKPLGLKNCEENGCFKRPTLGPSDTGIQTRAFSFILHV
jgi:hypothetical protein